MRKKEKSLDPYPRTKSEERKYRKWLKNLTVTPERMKEIEEIDAENKKRRKEWIEWQIKTYGFFESDAADY